MNKKNNTLFLAAALVIVLNFHSCKKYEDGPAFSLKTKKGRLTGEWELVKVNGQSMGSPTSYDIEWEFEGDGDFSQTMSYSSYSYSYNGEWEFSSDKEEIEITLNSYTTDFEITRLTNSELQGKIGTDEYEFEKK